MMGVYGYEWCVNVMLVEVPVVAGDADDGP